MPEDTKIIEDYTKDIIKEKDKIEKESPKMLEAVDLKTLVKNPRVYLKKLSTDYYNTNKKHIQKGIKIGQRKANRILENTNNDESN